MAETSELPERNEFLEQLEASKAGLIKMLTECAKKEATFLRSGRTFGADYDPLEEILSDLAEVVRKRKIGVLRSVWTIPRSEKTPENQNYRLWELVLLRALKERFTPRECVFQASEISEEEERYLESIGIRSLSPSDQLGDVALEKHEFEMHWMANTNPVFLNDFLWSRWNSKDLSQLILVYRHPNVSTKSAELLALHSVANFDSIVQKKYEALFAATDLEGFANIADRCQKSTRNLFLASTQVGSFPRYSYAKLFHLKGAIVPQIPSAKPDYLHTQVPFYEDPSGQPDRLVEITTFADFDSNVEKIKRQFEAWPFPKAVSAKLRKILDGRTVNRICLAGVGEFANAYAPTANSVVSSLYQLVLALALKNRFRAPRVTLQEAVLTDFEKECLDRLGIELANDLYDAGEGRGPNEVTLYFLPNATLEQYNNIFWANRKTIRNVVVIGPPPFFGNRDSICKSTCGHQLVLQRNLRAKYDALAKFSAKKTADPLRLSTEAQVGPDFRAAFEERTIMAYPGDSLPEVGDEKPDYSKLKGEPAPPCVCKVAKRPNVTHFRKQW
ncbi:hypothetical protein QR680_005894 [Steinernema hermaphroditum]|uniref:SRR1-like domain-containing protein n=1 Tax=Steinernema hermaphroditum TaxID=289476 RepID=A0AA39HTQ3_9BILA|nr:hypothetical protein QR680_005894 [Steinernema hermaphroditum]